MGTWDAGSFGNDTAGDWAYGLRDVNDLSYVEDALDSVLRQGSMQPVSAESSECAVAAAEIVARLKGRWGDENAYTAAADDWVRRHPIKPPQTLVTKALQALGRIVIPPSELLELWSEGGEAETWIASVAELRNRIEAS